VLKKLLQVVAEGARAGKTSDWCRSSYRSQRTFLQEVLLPEEKEIKMIGLLVDLW